MVDEGSGVRQLAKSAKQNTHNKYQQRYRYWGVQEQQQTTPHCNESTNTNI